MDAHFFTRFYINNSRPRDLKYEERKVGVAGLQPISFLHDYSKFES